MVGRQIETSGLCDLPSVVQRFQHYLNVGSRVIKVYDGTLFDELFLRLVRTSATVKHVLEDLGGGTQDAVMNAEIFSFGGEDNISVLFPWVDAIYC